MTLTYDNSALQARAVPNAKAVFLFSATSESAFSPQVVTVNFALRRAPTKEELEMFPHIEVVWHLWGKYLFGTVPKRLDVIQDGGDPVAGNPVSAPSGVAWRVDKVFVQAWAQRYRCLTFHEDF